MDIKLPYKYKRIEGFDFWDKVYCFNRKIDPKDFDTHLAKNLLDLEKESHFDIYPFDNKELEHLFAKMQRRDKVEGTNIFPTENKENELKCWAKQYASALRGQFKNAEKALDKMHPFSLSAVLLKKEEPTRKYPLSVKALFLNEFANRIYDSEPWGTSSAPRDKKRSIGPGLILNEQILSYILENVDAFPSFKKLYFSAIEEYKKTVITNFELKDVKSPLGKWLMFPGWDTDYEGLAESGTAFAAISMGTSLCTKTLAPEYLNTCDAFVFVDNDDKFQILNLVNTNQKKVFETCGTQPDQQIAEEFKPTAKEFFPLDFCKSL